MKMGEGLSYFCRSAWGSAHAGFVTVTDAWEWAGRNSDGSGYTVVNIDGHPVNRMGAIL